MILERLAIPLEEELLSYLSEKDNISSFITGSSQAEALQELPSPSTEQFISRKLTMAFSAKILGAKEQARVIFSSRAALSEALEIPMDEPRLAGFMITG